MENERARELIVKLVPLEESALDLGGNQQSRAQAGTNERCLLAMNFNHEKRSVI
jgi:hypothetical protein